MCKKVGKSRKSRIARKPARAVVIPLCLVMLLYILIDLRYPEYWLKPDNNDIGLWYYDFIAKLSSASQLRFLANNNAELARGSQ